MQRETNRAAVLPKPLLLQAVSKVEQVVARLQELQCSISAFKPATPSKMISSSCRMPDLLSYSPNKKGNGDRRVSGDSRKFGRMASSKDERRKSLTLADGWRHWSSPAKDVHDVISEIILASQLTKQFVNVIGRNSSFEKCQTYGLVKKITHESTNFTTDPSPIKKSPASALTNSFDSTPSEGDGDTKFAPTVCSSVESLESTPIPSGKGGAQINRRSSSKKHHSMRKPPPHVFKVVLSSEGPAAKSGTAISLRQLEARKLTESRKLTTPSPLYKRRSGTLVQKPCSLISTNPELRSSSTSQSSIIRGSIERKARLQNSASVRRSTEKFVEACRLLMEEEAQQKREAGIKDGSPPLVIKPLSFDSPSLRKAPAKRSKNWLIHRFSKSSVSGESLSAVAAAGIVKQRKKASKGSNLPTLISRLPAQKPETRVQDTPARVSDAPARISDTLARGSNHGVTDSLPLPPAHRSSAAGLAMKAMRDKKSGMTSYALAPVSTPRSSRELTTVDSNTVVPLKEKSKCSVGCPSKDVNSHSKSRTSGLDAGTRATTEQSMPSYMRPKSGAGKENNNNNAKMDSLRRSSAGILQKSAVPPKHSSASHSAMLHEWPAFDVSVGTSLLHRAKDWVLHKPKDKVGRKALESSQKVAVAG